MRIQYPYNPNSFDNYDRVRRAVLSSSRRREEKQVGTVEQFLFFIFYFFLWFDNSCQP